MQKSFSLRNIAIVVAAAITIWMVFNEGTLTAILFAGFFFFLGSLVEVFQRRERLERQRVIVFTVTYTFCMILIVGIMIWRYRDIFIG
jgi:FtsH-binding integral membrane protein